MQETSSENWIEISKQMHAKFARGKDSAKFSANNCLLKFLSLPLEETQARRDELRGAASEGARSIFNGGSEAESHNANILVHVTAYLQELGEDALAAAAAKAALKFAANATQNPSKNELSDAVTAILSAAAVKAKRKKKTFRKSLFEF